MSIHNKDSTKRYIAILNQTGSNDPEDTVLYNDIGTIHWARSGPGTYVGTVDDQPVPAGLYTIALKNLGEVAISSGAQYGVFRITDSTIGIQTNTPSEPSGADGLLVNTGIEIIIYHQYQ